MEAESAHTHTRAMDTLALLRRFCEEHRLKDVHIDAQHQRVIFGDEYAFKQDAHTALQEKEQPTQLRAVVAAAKYFLLDDETNTMRELQKAEELITRGFAKYISITYVSFTSSICACTKAVS